MRTLLLLGCSALALGLAACVTPERRAANTAAMCDASSARWTTIAPPANAEAYRAAAGPRGARHLRRRWPFHEFWFRSTDGKTTLCNVNPDWREACVDNQYAVLFHDSAAGPVKEEDFGAICID